MLRVPGDEGIRIFRPEEDPADSFGTLDA